MADISASSGVRLGLETVEGFRLRDQRVLADIGTLDIGTLQLIVYNLKSIGNLTNLNMSFTVTKFTGG